jgi:hypothetical protein
MANDQGLSMEERVTSLFQPDTLLPEQYLDTYRRKLHLEPEKKLMLAILEDGIACFQKYLFARDSKGKALFREAEAWVEEKGGEAVFSFDAVCESLGLDPNYLRRGLSVWKARALAQYSQARLVRLTPTPKRAVRASPRSRPLGHRLRRVVNR